MYLLDREVITVAILQIFIENHCPHTCITLLYTQENDVCIFPGEVEAMLAKEQVSLSEIEPQEYNGV